MPVYTFRSETEREFEVAIAIASRTRPRTLDTWQDEAAYWLKVWTGDRSLPYKIRPHANLERVEW
ncbi:hypothetical protein HNI00_21920 [Thermoleptolyngbya oregonensis NK1-22]|uniref:Uncharacterized protein n=1 Tax=Thermoleptolyngbya oregonensis NK1-22 TaxID=2547457 RepID=A0AA97BNH8_9CYAN|nr:hypothetical protein [Thermoleptolyngbya oregonensis]WOB45492.1 hypothetical protein HNI00_21920 [Thermoleptolyngbya oregonensis NK1-22]